MNSNNEDVKTSYGNTLQRLFPAIMSAKIRSHNEDFIVNEIPSITPSGSGEHVWLKLQKSGENSDWLAGHLARIADLKRRDVSYAGMKDRHAVTTQWFSVHLPGKSAPDWSQNLPDSIQLLEEVRHERKLRLGALQGNQFILTLRECQFHDVASPEQIEQRIKLIREQGVPNYFGQQRFGHNFNNCRSAKAWFLGEFQPKKRQLQSIFLSSARAWIFNQILSQRVADKTWNQAIEGDVFMFTSSKSWFFEQVTEDIIQRVKDKQLNPTAALWGAGELASQDAIQVLENQIMLENKVLAQGLVEHKLRQDRRKLRLFIDDIQSEWLDQQTLKLSFSLPSGCYATTILDEIVSNDT
jgi:tRNA pseudouridine13 synthase